MANSTLRGWLERARFGLACAVSAGLVACSGGTEHPPSPGPEGGGAGRGGIGGGGPGGPVIVDPGGQTPSSGGVQGVGGSAGGSTFGSGGLP